MNMDTLQGAFPDGEWDFSRIFSPEDQLDFTSDQFLGQFSFPGENDGVLHHFTNHLAFCPNPETNLNNMGGANESLLFSWNNALNPDNLNHVSQENSISSNCSSSVLIPSSNHETYFFSDSSSHYPAANDITMSMDFCIVDENNSNSFVPVFPKISMTEAACASENMSNFDNNAVPDKELQLKRKFDIPKSEANPSSDTIKKKTRVARNVPKSKKNAKAKKNQKLTPNSKDEEEEERNGGQEGQSFSSCSSEEDNGSQDSNGGATSDSKMSSEALNSTGKVRASRGSATDPQSLYARKRRERINERLRILQNLVPNGTKVDISTMLEEAVQYVKFLQLQIKLLSSDDLWMYAPIAYNGMDIGLNHKISKLL